VKNTETTTAPTIRAVMYWDGVDHEDLYCVCGTPDPELFWANYWTGVSARRCDTCGAVADYDTQTMEWVIRAEVSK
jgi:hypothetical protein